MKAYGRRRHLPYWDCYEEPDKGHERILQKEILIRELCEYFIDIGKDDEN